MSEGLAVVKNKYWTKFIPEVTLLISIELLQEQFWKKSVKILYHNLNIFLQNFD